MGGLVEYISNYDNSRQSVGYSMFYYVNNMYGNSRFKLLSVDGVKPARDSITKSEYPFTDGYYAVIRKNTPKDSTARKLIEWLLSDEGQTVAVEAGYIPLRLLEGVEPNGDIDPIYLGETEESSGTGGTTPKTEEELVANGVRKPLSDLFYDGFNYIRYINDKITEQIIWGQYELYAIGNFTGIPNDYPYQLTPYATIWGNCLCIVYSNMTASFTSPYMYPGVFSKAFDLETGKAVNLADIVSRGIDRSEMTYHTVPLPEDEDKTSDRLEAGFVPAQGSDVTDVMVVYASIFVYITEPDGRLLVGIFYFGDE